MSDQAIRNARRSGDWIPPHRWRSLKARNAELYATLKMAHEALGVAIARIAELRGHVEGRDRIIERFMLDRTSEADA